MSKTVSVVVPIYNVEDYLEKCINSIINQTYQNLEIILVDDGSTDRSPSICNEWGEKDDRIVVIHKENGGLSSARNAGLKVATGEYIMFEDSDDWLELNAVEKCVERIEKDESDLVVFGYKKISENGEIIGDFTFGNVTYTKDEMTSQLHRRILEMSFGYAWNKLYRLSIIKNSGVVNDGNIIDREDLFFNLQLYKYLGVISYLDYVGYYYLQRNNSLLHNADLARLNRMDDFCSRIKRIKIGDNQFEKKVINMLLLHYISDVIIKNIMWNKKLSSKEKKERIKSVIIHFKKDEYLYKDNENPRYLNCLFKSISRENANLFYYYVRLSDIFNRFLKSDIHLRK